MRPALLFIPLAACATVAAQTNSTNAAEIPHALPSSPPTAPETVAIKNATLMTATGDVIQRGVIVLQNGIITAVGLEGTPIPEGARVIDGTGRFVTPGLIDAHSHMGVYPAPMSVGNDDGNEITNPVTAEVQAVHSFWPQDPQLTRAIAGGITTALILPGSANLIGGRGFSIKLKLNGRTADDYRFPGAKDVLKMACGENPKRSYFLERKAAPGTRMGNVAGYRTAWIAAADYRRKWEAWNKDKKGDPPLRDLKLETLAGVLAGEILVENHCYRADEMAVMIQLSHEFGYHIRAFHHAVEAYKLRDVLAKENIGVATWADWWGFKMESYDGIPENAALVSSVPGGHAIIKSDSPDGIQRLNQEAGKAMYAGRAAGIDVSEDEALRWITANPAWALGVEDRTGTLTVGKMADVVVWSGSPFSIYSRAQLVFVDGQLAYDRGHPETTPTMDFDLGQAGSEVLQ